MDVDGILLGDINQDNLDMSKGKLSTNDSVIIQKKSHEIIRSFPVSIQSDSAIYSIDATFDNFDPMMEIVSIDSIRPELSVQPNLNNSDKYANIITYARNFGAISTTTPLFYLRIKYKSDCLWRPEVFGNMNWYFNGKKVGSIAGSPVCTGNGEIITRPIHIYPNPSTGLFTIKSSEKLGTIRVYDALGRMIKTMETIDNQLNIDLTDYANGLYTVKIGQQVYKISKQ
jgi:Secretion system C-terminal sorting domain